ncbi:MAG: glycosyl transferase, partial [Candidatus Marinimicrobia bacterium]|nr:glycosyl transferase [Candidatus Neomarinimicrobiota bacterium]
IGHADWNDCLNLNCYSSTPGESFQLAKDEGDGKTAESVMIAGLFCRACDDMESIYKELRKDCLAAETAQKGEDMRQTIYKHGWDGEWFRRAYDGKGNTIGSNVCEEGKIFIESQGWCILGKAGLENGYAEKALRSVKKHLAEPNGIKLQHPAYQTYHLNLGEVSSYPPGYKENAGIFTHNNTWIQIAETMLGHGDQAMEYYKAILPSSKEDQIDIYRAEPYVYSQMTAGCDAPTPGEGKNSWLTGTAAWSFVAVSQFILGVRPEFKGLKIDPCIPRYWKEFKVTRKFRDATYKITVKNPDNISKGIKSVKVDGSLLDNNILPVFSDDKEHTVFVVMG